MGFYVDSADLKEIGKALELPFVKGVTTNPKLIAKAFGKREITRKELLDYLNEIKKLHPHEFFVQTNFTASEQIVEESEKIHSTIGGTAVIKIPATVEGFKAMKQLSDFSIRTAATAVYNGIQAYLAVECGAEYVIPYYSRVTRQVQDGMELIGRINEIINNSFSGGKLLVASVKNKFDILELLTLGVNGITVPYELIVELPFDSFTIGAEEEFTGALTVK